MKAVNMVYSDIGAVQCSRQRLYIGTGDMGMMVEDGKWGHGGVFWSLNCVMLLTYKARWNF